MKKKIIIVLVVLISLSSYLLSTNLIVDLQARYYMNQYGLHPVGEPIEISEIEEHEKFEYIDRQIVNEMSQKSGFEDLQKYRSRKCTAITYLLKERVLGKGGNIYATFIYTEQKIIGGVLYYPSSKSKISSLTGLS